MRSDVSKRDKTILAVFMLAGLRCNELRMLDVGDLDFEMMNIYVRFGKRSKERMVPLHPEAAALLKDYLGERASGAVFVSNKRGRISLSRLREMVKDAGVKAGLKKDLHPHALRHTFAVSLLEADPPASLEEVRDLLGHSSLAVTSIYLHCNPGRLRKAINSLTTAFPKWENHKQFNNDYPKTGSLTPGG